MINNSAYGAPPDNSVNNALQQALHRLAALDADNHRLRLQLFDTDQKHEDITDCLRTTEVELKYTMKKEAEKFEKELSIRVSPCFLSLLVVSLHLRLRYECVSYLIV